MKKEFNKNPPQHQSKQPGIESKMHPKPIYLDPQYQGAGKLEGKIAVITGGDSGIGKAVACYFAKEGADIFIHYLNEHEDAKEVEDIIKNLGRKCWLNYGNLQNYSECQKLIDKALSTCGKIDILVNNIAEQHPKESIEEISCEQMEDTFKTNFFSCFYMIKAALPILKKGAALLILHQSLLTKAVLISSIIQQQKGL